MNTENIEDIYEVSPIQHGILFHSIYDSELTLYFSQLGFTFHVRDNFNVIAFERAWQKVVDRHTMLRTSFYWEDIDKPLQVVYRNVKVPIEQHDWRGIEPKEQQKRFDGFLKSDRERGFDLSQAPLMRVSLIRFGDRTYQFIWSSHMIIVDGWSSPLVIKEVIELYTAYNKGQDINLGKGSIFRDYITWLRQQDSSKAEDFWRRTLKRLKATTELTNLYADNLLNAEERYDEPQIKLSKLTTTKLQSLARQHRLTINVIAQAAWVLLLSRYSCKNEVVYGCTVSGRPADLKDSESMVGMLINTLPVRVKVDGEQYLLSWLKQFQEQLVEIRQYEYTSLVDIQRWSELPPGAPLFDSIFVFENQPVDEILQGTQEQEQSIELTLNLYKTNYPLNLVGYPGSQLRIGISYDFRSFDSTTIAGILKHFEILLENIATKPEVRLKDLSLLTEQEQRIRLMLEKQATFNFDFCH
ncbi:non-ribosomal peptide synthetase [Chroococcidiopsis sp. FACHB-1243]|uniref:condensation domain-containing protein n=1 Tax=Chroococcidiopsis sp. [FACHB-1243] TaxID=2692781 RepID=UPI00177DF7BE|nr:condensation domain-containing protein [Chroococcidiopsis sp. [FACHB-1243]]MBD2309016.1 non-ribosomal peptide synthetase [Chroococcidiopsis sp. [FACHB-1243]]